MTTFKIFFAVICTFLITVFAVNSLNKRDFNKKIKNLNFQHKHETDSLKMEIAELNECLLIKNGLNL